MSMHPDLQERVSEEILKVCGDQGAISLDLVGKLPLLSRFIDETLRLRPPAPSIMRVVSKDHAYEELVLPEGLMVLYSVLESQRNPAYWEHPETFNPDRFLSKPLPFSYVPFSKGEQMCIGRRLALLETKMATAYGAHPTTRLCVEAADQWPARTSDASLLPEAGRPTASSFTFPKT